jgi:hypothetical protein
MKAWVALIALMLCGCATAPPEGTSAGASPPENYRAVAAEHVKSAFVDPYSIRDAEIAPPKLAAGPSLNNDGGFYTPWLVCVRANAKNRMGAYAGRQVTALAMSGNKVVNSYDEAHFSRQVCGDAVYEPFPEIETGAPRPAPPPQQRKR